jgi:hypothetical protein
MGVFTTAGLNLIATAVQAPAPNVAMAYVGISSGCGTISSGISSGVGITTIGLDAGLPVALAGGAGLTVTDGTNIETVTVGGGGAAHGVTTITISSWTPLHTYVAHVTAVCPTPLAADTALYNETVRIPAAAGTPGAGAGESLTTAYFDGTQATAIYLLVGYFGGSTATSTAGTGTLMGEDIQFWNHVLNSDTNMYQADNTI